MQMTPSSARHSGSLDPTVSFSRCQPPSRQTVDIRSAMYSRRAITPFLVRINRVHSQSSSGRAKTARSTAEWRIIMYTRANFNGRFVRRITFIGVIPESSRGADAQQARFTVSNRRCRTYAKPGEDISRRARRCEGEGQGGG